MTGQAGIEETAAVIVHCAASGPMRICVNADEPTITIGDIEEFCRTAKSEGATDASIVDDLWNLCIVIPRQVAPL